jgi:phosphoribosyl 1,2-cyclic phosphodiesterase
MAKIQVIGSSSKGNCYLLTAESETLIIEAGMPLSAVKKALNFNIANVSGCIITHLHGDHNNYEKQILSAGIPTVFQENGKLGGFHFWAFDVPHDVKNVAYLIYHKEVGAILYATDLSRFPYNIKGIDHLFIEANYDLKLLRSNPKISFTLKQRISRNHLSIDKSLEIAGIIYKSNKNLKSITLCHLSENNADEDEFLKKFTAQFSDKGISSINIATAGKEIEL